MKSLTIVKRPSLMLSEKSEAFLLFGILLVPLFIIAFNIKSAIPNIAYCLLFFSGWISWTFIEYYNHRFRMHGIGDHSNVIGYERHILHHAHPNNLKITGLQRSFLLMGNIVIVILSVQFKNWLLFPAGFYTGFVIYTLMHWFLHQKFSRRLFPEVHQFHIHHHCKHPDKCFGVTITWWDHLFNTIPHEQREITPRIKEFYYKNEPK